MKELCQKHRHLHFISQCQNLLHINKPCLRCYTMQWTKHFMLKRCCQGLITEEIVFFRKIYHSVKNRISSLVIDLCFPFYFLTISGFDIRIMLAFWNKFGSVLWISILWKYWWKFLEGLAEFVSKSIWAFLSFFLFFMFVFA